MVKSNAPFQSLTLNNWIGLDLIKTLESSITIQTSSPYFLMRQAEFHCTQFCIPRDQLNCFLGDLVLILQEQDKN